MPTKKAPKPSPHTRASAALGTLADFGNVLSARVASASPQPYSQDDLAMVQALKAAKALAESALKLFDAQVRSRAAQINECYVPGALTLSVEQTYRRSVSWQDEAVKLARRIAEMESRPFVEDVYLELCRNSVPATVVLTVKVQPTA